MTIKRKAIVLAGLVVTASACTHADREFVGMQDPGFGDANRATFAAMVINPDPQYADPIPPTSAEHAAQAIERYRNDQVKQPERIDTTEISSGSGGN